MQKIQNAAIRIITGAFRSSPISSLHAETNIAPIELQLHQACTQYYLRTKRIPDRPHATALEDFLNSTPESDFNKRIRKVVDHMEIRPLQVVPEEPRTRPPWTINVPKRCPRLHIGTKTNVPAEEMRQIFLEHLHQCHREDIAIYTDGSRTAEHVGAAAVVPALNISDTIRLSQYTSIFTAELVAISIAVDLLLALPQKSFVICSDSSSAIHTVTSFDPSHQIAQSIQDAIHCTNKQVRFCWSPAHTGINGNERADSLAKACCTLPVSHKGILYEDLEKATRRSIKQIWQDEWDITVENKLHAIKPKLENRPSSCSSERREETNLMRLRIGHCNFSHKHLMEKKAPPNCSRCKTQLTVEYLLVYCTLYGMKRQQLFPELNQIPPEKRLCAMLSESEYFDYRKIMNFLSSTPYKNGI